jgi:hypothetical protein
VVAPGLPATPTGSILSSSSDKSKKNSRLAPYAFLYKPDFKVLARTQISATPWSTLGNKTSPTMQTNSLSLHDNQEMLHDREHTTATKRKCAREREREEERQRARNGDKAKENERREGHKGNEEAEENYFLLFWMKTE